jgi:hypothetical protein
MQVFSGRPGSRSARIVLQGLLIEIENIGMIGKIENIALESDFDRCPEKPGDFLYNN